MMVKSSLRPVCGVIDLLRSTSFSFLMPSGVISNAQAKNIASGKPRIMKNANAELIQPGKSRAGPSVSPTCMISQPTMM